MCILHWSLIDSKCLQVSRTLLSILVDLDNAVIWLVSFRSPKFQLFQSPFQALGDRSKCWSHNWLTVSLIFGSFLSSPAKSKYLSLYWLSLIFTLWSTGTANHLYGKFFFCSCYLSLGLIFRWPVYISKSLRIFLLIYYLVVRSSLIFCTLLCKSSFLPSQQKQDQAILVGVQFSSLYRHGSEPTNFQTRLVPLTSA